MWVNCGPPAASPIAKARRLVVRLDRFDPDRRPQHNSLSRKHCGEAAGQFRVVARQERAGIDHRDGGAEAAIGLRQLDADRAAADHDQVFGPLAIGENRFIGQVGHAVETGDRRHDRSRSGGDDKAARPDQDLAGLRGMAVDEVRFGAYDMHAEAFEPLLRVVRGDPGDDPLDAVGDRGEIDPRRLIKHAELGAMPPAIGEPGCGQQRFRRHAAIIETVAAHPAALDEHHAGAHLHRPRCHGEPGGSGADHAQIGGERLPHAGCLLRPLRQRL